MPKIINNCTIVSYFTKYFDGVKFVPCSLDYFFTSSICVSL